MTDPFIKFSEQIKEAAKETIKQAGDLGVFYARSTDKFKVGKLGDAIKFVPIDEYSGFVIADKPYAIWLEDGNDQNGEYIYPVRAAALRFVIDGEVFFRRRVRSHEGYNFMRTAAEELSKDIPNIFEENFNRIGR